MLTAEFEMVSDHLLRSAKAVLDEYGPDALIHCGQVADKMIERGDVQGYDVWCVTLALLESARIHSTAPH